MTAEAYTLDAEHVIRFRFDRALIGAAYRPIFVARGAWFFAIVGLFVGVNWFLAGEIPGLVWATIVVVSCVVTLRLWQVWRQAVSRTLASWREQAPDGEILLKLGAEAFQVCLGSGSMLYKWSGLQRLHRRRAVWCLEVVRDTHVPFPPEAASDAAKAYVVDRCTRAGAKV